MEWQDTGTIISVRKHGETSTIVDVLTEISAGGLLMYPFFNIHHHHHSEQRPADDRVPREVVHVTQESIYGMNDSKIPPVYVRPGTYISSAYCGCAVRLTVCSTYQNNPCYILTLQ